MPEDEEVEEEGSENTLCNYELPSTKPGPNCPSNNRVSVTDQAATMLHKPGSHRKR